VEIRIRDNEGCDPPAQLLWDTVFDPKLGVGDWTLAGSDEPNNRGGLAAKRGLVTAVVLALFTDKRCPADHPLRQYADQDPRGYFGDGVDVREDLGEAELGSLLWLLERSVVTEETAQWARAFAIEALAPLQRQNAVARIDVFTTARPELNRLDLGVDLYARDGVKVFSRQFDILWRQVGP
jgi:phage gp46-like protein